MQFEEMGINRSTSPRRAAAYVHYYDSNAVVDLENFRIPRPVYTRPKDNYGPARFRVLPSTVEQTPMREEDYSRERLIIIYKSRPNLGIAIEGGANTRQPLPRVIEIKADGCAFHSGLKVGHIIFEVNGIPLRGMEHQTAAKSIAEAFRNKLVDRVELLVHEPPGIL